MIQSFVCKHICTSWLPPLPFQEQQYILTPNPRFFIFYKVVIWLFSFGKLWSGTLVKKHRPTSAFGFKVPFALTGDLGLVGRLVLKVWPQSGINKDCLKVVFQDFPPCLLLVLNVICFLHRFIGLTPCLGTL